MNINEIVMYHYKQYKNMEIIDVVKLLYQHEFGGGHLISDKDKSLNYIINEYNSVKKHEEIPLYVEVGNGLIRLNLNSIESEKIDLNKLNDIFVLSSQKVHGDIHSFIDKLNAIRQLIIEKKLNYNIDDFDIFINEYKNLNYPMVSHSKKYKEYYYPAYRIILKEYLKECLK